MRDAFPAVRTELVYLGMWRAPFVKRLAGIYLQRINDSLLRIGKDLWEPEGSHSSMFVLLELLGKSETGIEDTGKARFAGVT